jgi:hypothetical protein
MQVVPSVLALVGCLCMTIALILAWCLVGVRTTGFMKRWFPSYQYLLKSHIDYLMMTGLLFIFFLLFTHFQVTPPALIVVGMCVGSLVNPAAFLALAIKPGLPQRAGISVRRHGDLQFRADDHRLRRRGMGRRACSRARRPVNLQKIK